MPVKVAEAVEISQSERPSDTRLHSHKSRPVLRQTSTIPCLGPRMADIVYRVPIQELSLLYRDRFQTPAASALLVQFGLLRKCDSIGLGLTGYQNKCDFYNCHKQKKLHGTKSTGIISPLHHRKSIQSFSRRHTKQISASAFFWEVHHTDTLG